MKSRAPKFLFVFTVLISCGLYIFYNFRSAKIGEKITLQNSGGYILAQNNQESLQKTQEETEEKLKFNFSLFNSIEEKQIKSNDELLKYIVRKLKTNYIENLEDEKLYESAIAGMISSLDPHSRYLNKQEYKDMRENLRGEFGGLGIVVTKNTELFITVISAVEDTPAFKAGIKNGDFISQIDDKSTFDMDLSQAVNLMRGKVGEKVKITVLRKGESKPLEFVLKREKIKTSPVKGKIIDGNILYIKITEFRDNLQRDTINIFNKLKPNLKNAELKGFILDLRNNPGGLLNEAVSVAELFLDKDKVVVSTKDKYARSLNLYKTGSGNLLINKNIPMVVLVNNGSASASEIVAGAVQDYKRGLVLGTKTFGKASVQTVFPLTNGGAMLITTARYYTPLNRSIQLDGINPDIVVKQGKITFDDNKYDNFSESSLKGHLKREGEEDIVTKTIKENSKEKKDSKNEYNDDYQLLRAISLIDELNFIDNRKKAIDVKKETVKQTIDANKKSRAETKSTTQEKKQNK